MRYFFFKRFYCFLFLALIATQIQGAALELSLPGTKKDVPQDDKPQLSYSQLRNYLMDFADRYMQMVGQAVDTLQRSNGDPNARTGIQALKLFPCSAAFSIAIDSNPRMALLNMEVLVRLQGSVWKDELPKKYGPRAANLLNVQKELEADIDAIALRVLTQEQLDQLKTLVTEWRVQHPDQRYVSYIRFSDFSEMQPRKHDSSASFSIAGLLSVLQIVNLDEATRSVDQTRMVAERTIYLSQRIPTILRWQTEMLFYGLEREGRTLIWECVKGCLVVILAIFLLALLFKLITRRL